MPTKLKDTIKKSFITNYQIKIVRGKEKIRKHLDNSKGLIEILNYYR
jgi:hypothetical protein